MGFGDDLRPDDCFVLCTPALGIANGEVCSVGMIFSVRSLARFTTGCVDVRKHICSFASLYCVERHKLP